MEESAMTKQGGTGDRRSPAAVALLIGLLLLPAIYVLSIGPVNWLVTNGYMDSDGPVWFYTPLRRLAERSETANHIYVWYLSLFGNV
jgi:hypothetical protein